MSGWLPRAACRAGVWQSSQRTIFDLRMLHKVRRPVACSERSRLRAKSRRSLGSAELRTIQRDTFAAYSQNAPAAPATPTAFAKDSSAIPAADYKAHDDACRETS